MAIGSSPYTGAHRNYSLLNQYVDWYNVMTYDLDQGWSGYSGYNAALYADGFSNDYSVDQSVTYLSGGRSPLIPKSKVVVGVPFYGKQFNSATFNTQFTGSPGYPLYSDIVKLTGWTRYWDDKAKVPYLSNGSSVITYDDSMSIALKCQYAKSQSLAGVMIWEISQDVIGSTQPLLDVIWDQMRSSPDLVEGSPGMRVSDYRLFDNYPNPFNPSTMIRFSIPQASTVALKVFDLLGRETATVVFEELSAGTYSREWNAADLSSGVYFYRLQAGSYVETKKLVILR
jgi:chitinase